MKKLTVKDINLKGKRVLIRVDFNVPLNKETGEISDDTRIRESLPTIEHILKDGGKAILMSHLGRPDGKVVPSMSLTPVAKRLGELLGVNVEMAPDCIGEKVKSIVNEMKEGECVLLENLRFYPEEEKNDKEFARKLSEFGDVYVNDAFGTAHRAHASTEGVAHFFNEKVAGFLMEKEILYLGEALENPKRPFVALLGGAKISDKIQVIQNLLPRLESLLIGGGMAFTFYSAQGLEVGKSILEKDSVDFAKDLLKSEGEKIFLPPDCVVVDNIDLPTQMKTVLSDNIPDDMIGVDIGEESVRVFSKILKGAKTILWNGPVGIFEIDKYAGGTMEIAKILGKVTEEGATTIVGGGDSVSAIFKSGCASKISHISTGGGASLEFLSGKTLPGIGVLKDG